MEFSSFPVFIDWLESGDLAAVASRAFVGFVAAWALFKLGKKRFLKRGSAFDALIVIMIGAVLGRGIAEGDGFLGTLLAGAVIMATHWLFAWVAHETPFWSRVIEGHERCLMRDGVLDRRQMRRALVSEADIVQALRLRTGDSDLGLVEAAWQEKSGDISLKLKGAP
jgi:uncharacterized membrane protein YcaP (DUF421 family)